jgi:hypothetical protein
LGLSALHRLGEELRRVRIELSIIVLPMRTTRPPNFGIDAGLDLTVLPFAFLQLGRRSASCAASSGCALVTSAVTSPRAAAAIAEKATSGRADRRRLPASTPRKFLVSGARTSRLAILDDLAGGFAADLRVADQRGQIGRFADRGRQLFEIAFHGGNGVLLARQIIERRCVTPLQAGRNAAGNSTRSGPPSFG